MSPAAGARQVEIEVRNICLEINRNAISRATRGVNILRSTALDVLGQNGSGRRYRNGHVASAPGQPPAPDTGNLRRNWRQKVFAAPNGRGAYGLNIKMSITSDVKYFVYLDKGTRFIAPRPIREPIKQKARPRIQALFSSL